MTDVGTLTPAALCLLTVLVAGGGSLLPVSPSEPMMVAVAAVAPPWLLAPLTVLATVSSMVVKVGLYLGARALPEALPEHHRGIIDRLRPRLDAPRHVRGPLLVASAAFGVPPFYPVTILCGVLRIPLMEYVIVGTVGRAIRFAVLLYAPGILAGLL